VFTISSFGLYGLYITGNKNIELYNYLTLIVAVLAQQKDPWKMKYTLIPIVGFFVVGLVHNMYHKRGMPNYDAKMILKGSRVSTVTYTYQLSLSDHTYEQQLTSQNPQSSPSNTILF
jgi:hypothetical protein